MHNVSRKMVQEWMRNKDFILSQTPQRGQCRSEGGGRKSPNLELEKSLLTWVGEQRSKKYTISYSQLKTKALALRPSSNPNFRASHSWLRAFMERNHLSYRAPTHVAQQNTKTPDVKCRTVLKWLAKLNKCASRYPLDKVYNMDETPFYFDQVSKKTIDVIGAKTVDVHNSGNDKNRFTVVVTVRADGVLLPFFVIFNGLKHIPKVFRTNLLPSNVVVTVSMSGTMDQFIMIDYMNRVILPDTQGSEALMILDEFRAHFTEMVTNEYASNNLEQGFIPGGNTSSNQAIDVSINKPLSDRYEFYWNKWMASGNQAMTQGGNRQRPSYEAVASWLSQCHNDLSSQKSMLSKSFVTTGLLHRQSGYTDSQFVACLNPRLKELLFITDQSNFIRDKTFLNIINFDYALLDDLDAIIKPYMDTYQKSALEFFQNKIASRTRSQQCFDPLIDFNNSSVGKVLNVTSPLNGFSSMALSPQMGGYVLNEASLVNGFGSMALFRLLKWVEFLSRLNQCFFNFSPVNFRYNNNN